MKHRIFNILEIFLPREENNHPRDSPGDRRPERQLHTRLFGDPRWV